MDTEPSMTIRTAINTCVTPIGKENNGFLSSAAVHQNRSNMINEARCLDVRMAIRSPRSNRSAESLGSTMSHNLSSCAGLAPSPLAGLPRNPRSRVLFHTNHNTQVLIPDAVLCKDSDTDNTPVQSQKSSIGNESQRSVEICSYRPSYSSNHSRYNDSPSTSTMYVTPRKRARYSSITLTNNQPVDNLSSSFECLNSQSIILEHSKSTEPCNVLENSVSTTSSFDTAADCLESSQMEMRSYLGAFEDCDPENEEEIDKKERSRLEELMRTPDVKTAHQLLNTLAEFSPSNPFRSPLRVPSTPVASKRVLDVSLLEPADVDENSSSIQSVKDVPRLISATSTPFASRVFNSNSKQIGRESDSIGKPAPLMKTSSNSFQLEKRVLMSGSNIVSGRYSTNPNEVPHHSGGTHKQGIRNNEIGNQFEKQHLQENSNHINFCKNEQNSCPIPFEQGNQLFGYNVDQFAGSNFDQFNESDMCSTTFRRINAYDKPLSSVKQSREFEQYSNNTADYQFNQAPYVENEKPTAVKSTVPPPFSEQDENTVSFPPNWRPPLQTVLSQQTFIKIQRPPQLVRSNSSAPFISSLCPNKIVPEKVDQLSTARYYERMSTEYSSPNVVYKAPDFNRSFSSPISADQKSPLSPRVIGSAPLGKIKFREHSRSPIASNKSPSVTFKPFERSFGSPIAQIENRSSVTIKRQRPSIFEHPLDRENLRRIQNLPKKRKFGRLSPVKPSEDILPDVLSSETQIHPANLNYLYSQPSNPSLIVSSENLQHISRADEVAVEKCELFKSYSRDMFRVKLRHAAVQYRSRQKSLVEEEFEVDFRNILSGQTQAQQELTGDAKLFILRNFLNKPPPHTHIQSKKFHK